MKEIFFTKQFLKFGTVGVSAAFANWISRYLLNFIFSFPVAIFLAYGVGMLIAFSLNKIFVFPNSTAPIRQQITKFILINICMFPVVWVFSICAENFLASYAVPFSQSLAHAVAVLLPGLMSFLAYKFLAFKA